MALLLFTITPTAWAQNDGSGNSHDITPTTIKFGRQKRTYNLARWAFNTQAFSVRDFPHNFQASDFLNDQLAVLRHYQRCFIVNWKRERLCGNTDRKIAVQGTGPTDYYEANNQTANFEGLDQWQQLPEELVRDRFLHVHALRRDARLPGVAEPGDGDLLRGRLVVAVRLQDHRRVGQALAAEGRLTEAHAALQEALSLRQGRRMSPWPTLLILLGLVSVRSALGQRSEARAALDQARSLLESYGVRTVVRLVRARRGGPAIVEEARQRNAELVVMGAPRRPGRRRTAIFGPTVDYVLKASPCRVLLTAGRRAA